MKVVCILDGEWYYKGKWYKRFFWSKKRRIKATGPKKDEVSTVESEYWRDGEKYYRLVEWPRDDNGGYDAAAFRPLQESTTEYKEVTFTEIKKETPIPSEN